jgi:hypothetical protein
MTRLVGMIMVVERTQSKGEYTIPNLCRNLVEKWTVRLYIPSWANGLHCVDGFQPRARYEDAFSLAAQEDAIPPHFKNQKT